MRLFIRLYQILAVISWIGITVLFVDTVMSYAKGRELSSFGSDVNHSTLALLGLLEFAAAFVVVMIFVVINQDKIYKHKIDMIKLFGKFKLNSVEYELSSDPPVIGDMCIIGIGDHFLYDRILHYDHECISCEPELRFQKVIAIDCDCPPEMI